MKAATWNVNSLRVRIDQLLDWAEDAMPDVVCLQETKTKNEDFPVARLEQAGFQSAFAGQPTYNGVAILARQPVADIQVGIPGFEDPQQRVIAGTVNNTRVINLYVPNGKEVGSDKYAYKLEWLSALHAWLAQELGAHPRVLVAGDFNIAPADADVHDPEAWRGRILCSDAERAAFEALIGLGLEDCFRRFEQPDKAFSWWDYRGGGFRRNHGLRIDHLLASGPLAASCTACHIDREPRTWERPSDHTPVIAEFEI